MVTRILRLSLLALTMIGSAVTDEPKETRAAEVDAAVDAGRSATQPLMWFFRNTLPESSTRVVTSLRRTAGCAWRLRLTGHGTRLASVV